MDKIIKIIPIAFSLTVILAICPYDIFAQLPDGTFGTTSYYQMLQQNYSSEQAIVFDTSHVNISATLTVYVHIISDSTGGLGISKSLIDYNLDYANKYFKNIGVSFKLGKIDSVKEYPHGYIFKREFDKELLTKYDVPHCINIYLADSINLEGTEFYGYTYFPDDTIHNDIYMKKAFFFDKALLTQLGHFFGLLSTYDAGHGKEMVDESNCSTAGDLLCDTYADGGTLGFINGYCEYIGASVDPAGKFYVPSVANFMTDGTFDCRCLFTYGQYRRMYYYYKNYRNYLR